MKVLHLLGANADNGGILSMLRGLHLASSSRQLEHCIWVNTRFQETRQPALAYCRSPHALDESHSHLRFLWQAIRALPGLRRWIRHETPDVVHGHSRGSFPLVQFLSRTGTVPTVFTNHAYARRTTLYRRAALAGKSATVLLTPSMALHYGIPQDHPSVHLISACALDSHFEGPLANPDRPSSSVQLVGVGNLVGWKKWDLLLEALFQLDDPDRSRLHLTIWGPIPPDPVARQYARKLEERIEHPRLKNRVVLGGPNDRVSEALQAAHWFVLPSTQEPCSVALIEALAHGVPALVSKSGGNVDIVSPGVSGAFFDSDSVDSLRGQLQRIARNTLPTSTPDAIRETVRDRSATQVCDQYEKLYRTLI